MTSPDPDAAGNGLTSVSASSPSSAWAVGFAGSPRPTVAPQDTLVLHWNGTAWSQVTSPNPSGASGINALDSVSAVPGGSAIATGEFMKAPKNHRKTMVLQGNGTTWAQVASPSPGGSWNELDGVSGLSAGNAWAAGWEAIYNGASTERTLIEHWNGTTWAQVPSPSPSRARGGTSVLNAISADSATDAWAVGSYAISSGTVPLFEHWNGTAWSKA